MKNLRGDYATLTTIELVPTGTKLLNTEADEILIPTSLQLFSQGMLVLRRAGNWRQGDFGPEGWASPLPPQGPKACCLKNSVVWNHIRPCIPHSHLQLWWWSFLSSCPPGPPHHRTVFLAVPAAPFPLCSAEVLPNSIQHPPGPSEQHPGPTPLKQNLSARQLNGWQLDTHTNVHSPHNSFFSSCFCSLASSTERLQASPPLVAFPNCHLLPEATATFTFKARSGPRSEAPL